MTVGAVRGAIARRRIRVTRLCICGAMVICTGCGRPQTTVTGVITLDGKPVDKAIVQFFPEHRNASTAVTVTDVEGRFATALEPAAFRVTVIAQVVDGKKANPDNPKGPPIDRYTSAVPERYSDAATTPLRVESVAGECTVADFDIPEIAQPEQKQKR